MKIINENKQEKLPIDFITSFISKSWEEVGVLKASIEGIKKEFKNTKQVENILEDLMDSYLICLSRLQAHLDNKNYLDLPEEDTANEALSEDWNIEVDPANNKISLSYADNLDISETEIKDEPTIMAATQPVEAPQNVVKNSQDDFEYFCDFSGIAPTTGEIGDIDELLNINTNNI